MGHLNRHIFIWLFLFCGSGVYASHVLGGEISYKHIKENQYRVTLNIYRDCNGCKINGNGGGSSSENCSEIDYLYVKGSDKTSSKETKFALSREKVEDITSLCPGKISVCRSGSNSIYGIELQQFSAIIDLDYNPIKGFCEYYVYVSIAERNDNITTGQAAQNFCIDAYIQTCLAVKNNSPEFISPPVFIVNSSKTQYQSFFAFDKDNDSLVYSLTPSLYGIEKSTTYGSGFSYSNPLSVYCTETSPCSPDKNKETGFYIDKYNGTIIFIPTNASEIGVVALKVEEYRNISGSWKLIGYIKRDIQVYVKSSDGNNSPKFTNSDYFEVCEENELTIKIETKDDKNSMSMEFDTVKYYPNSTIAGSSFSQSSQNTQPYNYGLFKWTPQKGASNQGIYTFSISASDNFCPLPANSTQLISIKVKPKEDLKIKHTNLGCGNFEISTSSINSKSKLLIKILSTGRTYNEIFKTSSTLDSISFLPFGKYILKATLISGNGCETYVTDTIYNYSNKTSASILGVDNVCKETKYSYAVTNLPSSSFDIKWLFNSKVIGSGITVFNTFTSEGNLNAILTLQKGKWYCSDTLKKHIDIINLQEILSPDKLKACHNTGNYDLKTIEINPKGGNWTSNNLAFHNGFINTNINLFYYDDTIALRYEVILSGCIISKNINFVIQAVPEFELSSTSICEMKNPVLFEHLIKKPYKILDYNYRWELLGFNDRI
ncbi:MAG: hypothetical protein ACKVQB_02465, partial [Bacteroidia bacterium]